jgi:hypothetical protein
MTLLRLKVTEPGPSAWISAGARQSIVKANPRIWAYPTPVSSVLSSACSPHQPQ